ncbi:MAG: YabP/YqfC family sporulation protein [Bacillota bacterium]
MEQVVKEHSINLEKNILKVTGVTNVESFDSKEVVANLVNNSLFIRGENLNVVDLDIKGQLLIVKGITTSLSYAKKREKVPFYKKLFK